MGEGGGGKLEDYHDIVLIRVTKYVCLAAWRQNCILGGQIFIGWSLAGILLVMHRRSLPLHHNPPPDLKENESAILEFWWLCLFYRTVVAFENKKENEENRKPKENVGDTYNDAKLAEESIDTSQQTKTSCLKNFVVTKME